jgi:plasmid stabilization system protein ParE
MSRISYSSRATADLIRLFRFLADKDEETAKRAIKTIRDAFTPLSRLPKIGRPIEAGLRELVIEFGNSGYIALYDFDHLVDEIVILAVRHQLENDYV